MVEANIVNLEKKRRSELRHIRAITFLIILLVTASIAFSLWYNYQNTVATVQNNILIKVKAINVADFTYEGFISDLGELFVLSSSGLQPNSNLPKEKQEVITRSGTRLIRLNPTYLTRLVHELGTGSEKITRKIVSNNPTNPENTADAWEAAAIEQIESGRIDEKFEIIDAPSGGAAAVRYISPFVIRESCVSCHTGSNAGERYGGISVTLSYAPYFEIIKKTFIPIGGAHIAVWLLMLLILIAFSNSIITQLKKKNLTEDALLDTTAELNKEIEICNEFENELRESRKRFQELAQKDPLTNLFNRRRFFELAATEIKRMQRVGGIATLAMLDIDHFKRFNDTYGHIAGDNCLKSISSKIREIIREIDVVARYGGEEFIFLFPQTPSDYAVGVSERLRAGLSAAPIKLEDGKIVYITVSIGFTEIDPEKIAEIHHEAAIHTAINEADTALYHAKITRNATVDFRTIVEAEAIVAAAEANSAAEQAQAAEVEFKDPSNTKGSVHAHKHEEDLQKIALRSSQEPEPSKDEPTPSIADLLTDFSPLSTVEPNEETLPENPLEPELAEIESTEPEIALKATAALEETPKELEFVESAPEESAPEESAIVGESSAEEPAEPVSAQDIAEEKTETSNSNKENPPPPIEPISPEGFVLEEDEPINKKI
ncbi:MAG: diguanylate cyclase [Deferribacteraceae bacterium]|nr:diguanylate cyclase [Deferribacteraceae bacterium]